MTTKKPGKKSAFGGVKKVSNSTFKASAAAAEREEKEIKVVEKIESGESTMSTEAASRLTYKQVFKSFFVETTINKFNFVDKKCLRK